MSRLGRYAAAVCVTASVIAVSEYVLRADVPQVPTATWMAGGPFGDLPRDVASAVLPDGRLVVSGGSDSEGQPLAVIAIYDPASETWSRGEMNEARAGHTATALEDGRVLITGGRTRAGVTASVEIYDPATAVPTAAGGALSLPRADHAAARLADGRVLIVGGSDGSAVLAMAELFDPATGLISQLPVSLTTPRTKLSATALLDGHVLLAGGNDGSQDLASAEIFDAERTNFAETSPMHTARSGHVAMLLPDNSTVLIAGGTSGGTLLKSVERFVHWKDTFVADSNQMAAERSGAVGVPTSRDGVALVAGGGSDQAELYGFATLKTDQSDYAPGEIVTFSGSGWQPGETVSLTISEDADSHNDFAFTAVADEHGNIVNGEFFPIEDETFHHMGMRFYAMARGIASDAQVTFTDGGTLTISFAGDGSGSVHGEGAGQAAFDCLNTCTPATYTSNGGVLLTATPASNSTFVSWSSNVVCDPNPSKGCSVKMDRNQTVIATFNRRTVTKQDQSITFGALGSRTYGDADFAVSATASSTLPVTFTASGQCTSTGGTIHILGAGTCTVTAQQAGNASYNPAPDVSQSFTIAKATPVVSVTGGVFTYDGNAHAASATAIFNGVNVTGTFSFAYNGVSAPPANAGTYNVIASFTSADGANYANATGTGTITITKTDATVSVNGYTGVYDGQAHGATGSATGIGGTALSGLDLGASFTNVPGGTATWTFTDATGNYNNATGTAAIVISKADAAVSVNGYTGVYDAVAHGATGSATGIGGTALSGLDLGASFSNVPGGTATWTFTDVTGNYNNASGTAAIVLSKADATVSVSGYTGVYDGQAHGATGSATGIGGVALSGLALGASFTNVPGGTATWTFTDVTGNYNNASGTAAIVISKARQTIVVSTPAPTQALYNTSFTVAGVGGASGNPVTFGAAGACTNQGATFTMVSGQGICTVTFNQAGDGNYGAATAVVQTVGATPWQVRGFYQPVTSSAPGSVLWNVIKGGATVPLKFQIFAGVNGPEQTSLTAVKSMSLQSVACTGGAALLVQTEELTDTGGTSLRYDGTQFIQNWKTPKTPGACFVVTMMAADTSTISAYFQVK